MMLTILAMTTLDNGVTERLGTDQCVWQLLERRMGRHRWQATMMTEKDAVASLGQTGLGAMDLWATVVCREERLQRARP
jgi:hypothetical protein